MPEPVPQPRWSVIIVTFEAGDLIDRCVASVRTASSESVEIIVVDNASTDGSPQRLAHDSGLRVVANGRNLGFPRAVNQGLDLAAGELVTVLNPDAVLPVGFLDAVAVGVATGGPYDLISACQAGDPELRATTGPLLSTAEILGQVVLRRRGTARLGPPVSVAGQCFRPIEAGYLSGYCLMGQRATFQQLHGFDPKLFWAEDVDLSARATAMGMALGVCTSVVVEHEGTHTKRRHAALVTFFQLAAKIAYARRHAPRSLLVVAPVVAVVAAIRAAWFTIASSRTTGASQKALAYRAVVSHVGRRGWLRPDGWDPAVVDRLRGVSTPVETH